MLENMSEYTFPFDTCEKPNKHGIAQPYSVILNLINCIIILFFLLKTKHFYTFALLSSILLFELFHSFSHTIHIEGSVQVYITHFLVYLINITFFYALYCYTKIFPDYIFIYYLIIVICLDIYALLNLSILYYIVSQFIIFISLLLYYFPLLPSYIKKCVYQIILLVIVIILLFLNEKYNCERMLNFYPNFPYHIFIETAGILFFYILCSNFYKL